MIKTRENYIYLRLSQEDMRDGSMPAACKFSRYREQCQLLADCNGISVPDANVLSELETGTKLSVRPRVLELLELCREGHVHHIITPAQDRIMRGDLITAGTVEDAFLRGRVILVTSERSIDFGSDSYDTTEALLFGVKAISDRYYVSSLVAKRRMHDAARTAQGLKSRGVAGYGLKWKPALWNRDNPQPTGHYEIVPDEYDTLCEIFKRARAESVVSIVIDLNKRLIASGSPAPPFRGRGGRAGTLGGVWHAGVVLRILGNTLYAGYPAHRATVRRGRIQHLPESEWTLSSVRVEFMHPSPPPGQENASWHPISLDEQRELLEIIHARALPGSPRMPGRSLLTGLLFCSDGRRMARSEDSYRCKCRELGGEHHAGRAIQCAKVDALAFEIVSGVLDALPTDLLTAAQLPRSDLRQKFAGAIREQTRLEQIARSLMSDPIHKEIYADRYEMILRENASSLNAASAAATSLQKQLAQPDISSAVPLLIRVRSAGVKRVWAEMTIAEQREVARLIIAQIQLISTGRPGTPVREATVTLQPWTTPYYTVPQSGIMPFPTQTPPSF